jgi:hypothetical protein
MSLCTSIPSSRSTVRARDSRFHTAHCDLIDSVLSASAVLLFLPSVRNGEFRKFTHTRTERGRTDTEEGGQKTQTGEKTQRIEPIALCASKSTQCELRFRRRRGAAGKSELGEWERIGGLTCEKLCSSIRLTDHSSIAGPFVSLLLSSPLSSPPPIPLLLVPLSFSPIRYRSVNLASSSTYSSEMWHDNPTLPPPMPSTTYSNPYQPPLSSHPTQPSPHRPQAFANGNGTAGGMLSPQAFKFASPSPPQGQKG